MLIWQENIACFLAIHHFARGYWTLALALLVVSRICSHRPYKKFLNSFSPTPPSLCALINCLGDVSACPTKKPVPGAFRIQNMQKCCSSTNWEWLSNKIHIVVYIFIVIYVYYMVICDYSDAQGTVVTLGRRYNRISFKGDQNLRHNNSTDAISVVVITGFYCILFYITRSHK